MSYVIQNYPVYVLLIRRPFFWVKKWAKNQRGSLRVNKISDRWKKFCDPLWELICCNKWHPRISWIHQKYLQKLTSIQDIALNQTNCYLSVRYLTVIYLYFFITFNFVISSSLSAIFTHHLLSYYFFRPFSVGGFKILNSKNIV